MVCVSDRIPRSSDAEVIQLVVPSALDTQQQPESLKRRPWNVWSVINIFTFIHIHTFLSFKAIIIIIYCACTVTFTTHTYTYTNALHDYYNFNILDKAYWEFKILGSDVTLAAHCKCFCKPHLLAILITQSKGLFSTGLTVAPFYSCLSLSCCSESAWMKAGHWSTLLTFYHPCWRLAA